MEILFYIFLLLICELFVYGLVIGVDYYCKFKKCKLKKANIIMFRSKYENGDKISCIAYWFQLFNYFYILIYLLFAIIDSFFYNSVILFSINVYSWIIYLGLVIIFLIIISILSPKKE